MNKLLLMAVLVTCSSCATLRFSHPSKGQQDYNRDWTNCQARMGQAQVGGLIHRQNFMSQCMEGEGWQRVAFENDFQDLEPQIGRLALNGILKWEDASHREWLLGGPGSHLERFVRSSQGL